MNDFELFQRRHTETLSSRARTSARKASAMFVLTRVFASAWLLNQSRILSYRFEWRACVMGLPVWVIYAEHMLIMALILGIIWTHKGIWRNPING